MTANSKSTDSFLGIFHAGNWNKPCYVNPQGNMICDPEKYNHLWYWYVNSRQPMSIIYDQSTGKEIVMPKYEYIWGNNPFFHMY